MATPADRTDNSETMEQSKDTTTGAVVPGDSVNGSNSKRQVGRNEWKRMQKRKTDERNDGGDRQKRMRVDLTETRQPKPNPFTQEEIAAEERRPKRKVAVLVGYSGTGYKGMQINDKEKTIEGELFTAFVAAGAISKANANDPKKSSLVRCARTDKGVHAAGNVISLKLIVDEADVVAKINSFLPEQIRVWGIVRTMNHFSCYQSCDSRWYEYLLPTYALLPPHPKSFMGNKVVETAQERGVLDEVRQRLQDVEGFWEKVDEEDIQPIIDALDADTKAKVLDRIHRAPNDDEDAAAVEPATASEDDAQPSKTPAAEEALGSADTIQDDNTNKAGSAGPRQPSPVDLALRDIKLAYIAAKRRFRVSSTRLEQLQEALEKYQGTNNFHNYTVQKDFKDASAKRHIISFVVNKKPIVIGETEWVSMKVHGQSFMMHQIRKLVGLATMLVRCGASSSVIRDTYGPTKLAIPKAPSLGLLLERPVFNAYNKKAEGLKRDPIDFDKYTDVIDPFKHEFIYKRMFELEEKSALFHSFYDQIDSFKSEFFLWATAAGIQAAAVKPTGKKAGNNPLEAVMGDEDENPEGGEG